MNNRFLHPARQLCLAMKRVYDRCLTTMTGGNLSMMDADGNMWVTPTGVDKCSLRPEDIVMVKPDGSWEGIHPPTSEYRIHHRILLERPDLKAVVHAHSPSAVTMSILHQVPDPNLYALAGRMLSSIGLAEFALPGTMELVELVGEVFSKGYDTAILKNHAAFLASSTDIFDAVCRFEELDNLTQLQINAHTLGAPRAMAAGGAEVLDALAKGAALLPYTAQSCAPGECLLRQKLAELSRRAYERKLFTGTGGVISARVDGDSFIIGRMGRDNAELAAADFVRVETERYEGQNLPDETWRIHQKIYEQRPDVQSVMMATPVCASTFAVTDEPYDVRIIPESYGVLRNCARFPLQALAQPDTLAQALTLETPFALIENYGVLVVGPNPALAFDKLEVGEFSAQSIHHTRIMGQKVIPMADEFVVAMDNQ